MDKTKRKLKNSQVKSKDDKGLNILKDLSWDYKWKSVIKNLASSFVIVRVVEIGNKEQVKTLTYFEDAEKEPKFPMIKKSNGMRLKIFYKGICKNLEG